MAESCEITRVGDGEDGDGLPPVVFVEDLARLLTCTPKAIRSRVSAGQLPKPFKIGKRLAWTRDCIRAWLLDRSRSAARPPVHITITTYSYKDTKGLQAIYKMQFAGQEVKTTGMVPAGMDRDQAKVWAAGQVETVLPKLMAKAGLAAPVRKAEPQPTTITTNTKSMTFKQFIDSRFVPEYVARWKSGTRDGYLRMLRDHLLPFFADLPMAAIDEDTILRFGGTKMENAPGTRNGYLSKIRMILAYAKKAKLITQVPDIERFPDPRPDIVTFSFEEIEQVLAVAEATSEQAFLVCLLAVEGSLRVSEICALKWTDIDLKRGHVVVRRNVYKGQEQLTVKGNKALPLALSERLREALVAHKDTRQGDGPLVIYRWMKRKQKWAPLDQRSAYDMVNKAATTALGKVAGCHFLRHCNLTLLEEIGVIPANIQAHARHTRLSTTENYLHSCKVQGSRAAMARLDEQRAATSKTKSKRSKQAVDGPRMLN